MVDDFNIRNIFLVDDGIMFVDLEMWYEVEPEEVEEFSGWGVVELRSRYAKYLICMDEDELS